MCMWQSILKAARFAKKAHAGQVRKHGEPYFNHPKAVARLLWHAGHREPELIKAAYLHDTVEDCKVDVLDLWGLFGEQVALLVSAVTHRKQETYEESILRIKAAPPLAAILKKADREHNNSQIHLLPDGHPAIEKAKYKTEIIKRLLK